MTRLTVLRLASVPVVLVLIVAACARATPTPTSTPTPTPRVTPTPTLATTPTPIPPGTPTPLATPSVLSKPAGDIAAGEKVFQVKGCVGCHQVKGTGGQVGPSLDGLFGSKVKLADGKEVTADEAYIRESIVKPEAKIAAGFQPIMPALSLPKADLDNLIAFIASLKE